MDWIPLAQNRIQFRVLLNTQMNYRFPRKARFDYLRSYLLLKKDSVDELQWACKEAVAVYFGVLSQYLTGGIEENHQHFQSVQQIWGLRFELRTF